MKIIEILRSFRKKIFHHEPLIAVEISRENLLHNWNEFKTKFHKVELAPVLKSNAYGHGLTEVAKILASETPPFLIVDSLFEARQLRHSGIRTKILIIGFVRPKEILSNRLKNVSFAVVDFEQLKEIGNVIPAREPESRNRFSGSRVKPGMTIKKTRIHLKIDTGMHRQGIAPSQVDEAIKIIKNSKNIILEGVCSHLADADNVDEKMTQKQIEEWNKTAQTFRLNFGGPDSLVTPIFPSPIKFFHLSASTGFFFQEKIDANLARLGLSFYGINLGRANLNLKPVLQMKTILTSVKEIEQGETVGYGGTFVAKKKMKIATVPAGYFEGLDRRLSNSGFVKVKNVFCPIVGRVSMNITTIDVGAVPDVKVGDEAVLISQNQTDKNSVENIAQACGTIPYEVLVKIPAHLKRVII